MMSAILMQSYFFTCSNLSSHALHRHRHQQRLPVGRLPERRRLDKLGGCQHWFRCIGLGIGLDPAADWVVLEATGTYGSKLCYALGSQGVPFTQLSPSQSKGFLQAKKRSNHTDASDARALSEYGSRMQPPASEPPDERRDLLGQARRTLRQLRKQAQMVRNQTHALEQQAVQSEVSAAAYQGVLTALEAQIETLEAQVCSLTDDEMAQASKKLETIPGIGPASAREILLSTNGFKGFSSAK